MMSFKACHVFVPKAAVVDPEPLWTEAALLAKDCGLLSDGGVRVNANGYTVPDEFSLRFSGDSSVKSYKVIWRIGWDVGAKKIDT
jgi:hypothetical protein